MTHLLRMNGQLESVVEPLMLLAGAKRLKGNQGQGGKVSAEWQNWKSMQSRLRDVEMRALIEKQSQVERVQLLRRQA